MTDQQEPATAEHTHKFTGSSNVVEARLYGDELEVDFKNGSTYRYAGFTRQRLDEWVAARSAGGWFDANVKKRPDLHKVVSSRRPDAPARESAVDGRFGDGPVAPAPAVELEVDVDRVEAHVAELAREMYEAYTRNSRGLAHDGRPCPAWPDLGRAVRSHWCASALLAASRLPADAQVMAVQIGELRRQVAHAEQAAQTRLDQEVLRKTADIERDCEKLRSQVAELERQKRTGFAPWRANG